MGGLRYITMAKDSGTKAKEEGVKGLQGLITFSGHISTNELRLL